MINFNKYGNLRETITLSYGEFKLLFGLNESRIKKIERLLIFLKIFKSFGCTNVYIVGSFVSNKEYPGDIDLCVDTTGLDYRKFLIEYPEFLQPKEIDKIKKEHSCHFAAFFDTNCLEILDWFRKDRNNNPRGLVKIFLHDIENYDQKRKTI